MKVSYNVTGSERKRLVSAISKITDTKVKYLGMPSMAYEIDDITIDKDGTLSCEDDAKTERIAHNLIADGFTTEITEPEENYQPKIDSVCISMPVSIFSDQAMNNLRSIIESKGGLIRKALGVADLPIEVADDKISFPWFCGQPSPEELNAYDMFICRLCDMARNQQRVTAKDKDFPNDKYAFRCFLLRLGFIGEEYKVVRKILLRNLTGSSAFKGGAKDDVSE
jgi:hypothetical protein